MSILSNQTDEEISYALDRTRLKPPEKKTIPICCESEICSQQFRQPSLQEVLRGAYSRTLDDSEAESIAAGHIKNTFSHFSALKSKCAIYGKQISSHWRKKSRDKRAEILLSAEPELERDQWIIPVPVKPRTYTILREVFTSNPESKTKTVDWDAFVIAMAGAGFVARHSSGSAVIFEPDDWERGGIGKIVFHEPHPVVKNDWVMLRAMNGSADGKIVWVG